MNIAKFTCLLMATMGTAASAQDGDLASFRSELAGREVSISGDIGTGLNIMDDEALTFRDKEGNNYPVVLDAGRAVRRSLEGCKFAIFGTGSECKFDGIAEIELDGSQIRLIIFDATTIGLPGE